MEYANRRGRANHNTNCKPFLINQNKNNEKVTPLHSNTMVLRN